MHGLKEMTPEEFSKWKEDLKKQVCGFVDKLDQCDDISGGWSWNRDTDFTYEGLNMLATHVVFKGESLSFKFATKYREPKYKKL